MQKRKVIIVGGGLAGLSAAYALSEMPIADEDFVQSTRSKQGLNNIYYAGDFMGCPSMETALISGKRAADSLIKNVIVSR